MRAEFPGEHTQQHTRRAGRQGGPGALTPPVCSHPSSPLDPEEAKEQPLAVGKEEKEREDTHQDHPPGPHTRRPSPTARNQVRLNISLYWLGGKCFYFRRARLIFRLGKNNFFSFFFLPNFL